MAKLQPSDRAASLLHAKYIGDSFCSGVFYPGATIRHGLTKLEKLGYLDHELKVTASGKAWLMANHLSIPMMPR